MEFYTQNSCGLSISLKSDLWRGFDIRPYCATYFSFTAANTNRSTRIVATPLKTEKLAYNIFVLKLVLKTKILAEASEALFSLCLLGLLSQWRPFIFSTELHFQGTLNFSKNGLVWDSFAGFVFVDN